MTDEYISEQGIDNSEATSIHFQDVQDFGHVLRILRMNHGYSLESLSKKLSIPPAKIGAIERAKTEIPDEFTLRRWLKALGCKDNINNLIDLSKRFKVSHTVRLHAREKCNADIIRLLDRYKLQELTEFDKALLSLIGR